jgi:DNA-binding HxlR family transcriptional regulator/putative sterol carrier protein
MSTPRTYGERCAAARALDLVGERWALLVVRELLLGPMRFTDLRDGMPNAKPSVLSQRLRELEEGGVIHRRRLGPPVGTTVYELTAIGRELEPVVIELGRWGRLLPSAPDAVHTTDSFVLALKWRFDATRASELTGSYELRLGGDPFSIDIAQGNIDLRRGEPPAPDAVIELDASSFEAVVFNGQAPRQAEREGRLKLAGDRALARRFLQHYRPTSARSAAAA